MSGVTGSLNPAAASDSPQADQLAPLVYSELRKLAAAKLAQEKPGQTLDATALVHEAYVRLVAQQPLQNWDNQGHFFAAAAEAMRRILVEQARRKRSLKRGGDRCRVPLDVESGPESPASEPLIDILALDDVLSRFAQEEPVIAKLVELRYFTGLPLHEAATMLGISIATAKRYWAYARSWLFDKMNDG
ncbi:MAG: sigma-70 family RNA polymerase sigma factor [Planctomycetota bacterium]